MNAIDPHAPLIEPATLTAIDEALAASEAARVPRGHLGMSQIGNPDERTLWLKFRWSLPDVPTPRVMRIFQLGHYVEIELARLLRQIPGVDLHTEDANGAQFNFQHLGGHFAGSMDGAILGVPEAPKTWHVWEAKSVSAKRFAELMKKGVKDWSPEYYAQLQCYMGATGMERALFTAMNKDDCTIHAERVHREPLFWPAMQAKAERIITSPEPPASSWPDRTWYESRFLSDEAQAVYWGDRAPAPNCRNCLHCQPLTEGAGAVWRCGLRQADRTLVEQRAGCETHQYLPAFLAPIAAFVEHEPMRTLYRTQSGAYFFNGQPVESPGEQTPAAYSSSEIATGSLQSFFALAVDPFLKSLKVAVPGTSMEITDDDIPFWP